MNFASRPMSDVVSHRLQTAAHRLGVTDPLMFVRPLIERTFSLPVGDESYGTGVLTPNAAGLEASFSAEEPDSLRFTLEPMPPKTPPQVRRDEATRENRRLVGPLFGRDALHWFDRRSEEWRGAAAPACIRYGAFFGTSYDSDGLASSKVYYEMIPGQIQALPGALAGLAWQAMQIMPGLVPIFTSITCKRDSGRQRITFAHLGQLSLNNLAPLMQALRLEKQHPKLMQIFGLALGGRFDLPAQSVLLGLGLTAEGPEMEFYVLLGMIPDLPSSFTELVNLGLAEKPRELRAFQQWLNAFTPEDADWPGQFSVMSVLLRPGSPAKISLYLRPMEFEIAGQIGEHASASPEAVGSPA